MSHKVVIDQPSPSEGKNSKRKRGHNNQQKQHVFSSYKGISYHKRSSSGRPGSPHRYFDTSYDVIMSDGDVASSSDRREVDAPTISQQTKVGDNADTITSEITTVRQSRDNNNNGNQVVHCHLNGLCIITAGNILDKMMAQSFKQKTIDNEEEEDVRNKEEVEISTIQYHDGVGKDSQSALGKMRTKIIRSKRIININSSLTVLMQMKLKGLAARQAQQK